MLLTNICVYLYVSCCVAYMLFCSEVNGSEVLTPRQTAYSLLFPLTCPFALTLLFLLSKED